MTSIGISRSGFGDSWLGLRGVIPKVTMRFTEGAVVLQIALFSARKDSLKGYIRYCYILSTTMLPDNLPQPRPSQSRRRLDARHSELNKT